MELEYFDISPLISENTAVFPGDKAFSRKVSFAIGSEVNFELSHIETSVHIGAHADAPSHYAKDGESIETRSLNYYFGKCQVIHVRLKRGERIKPQHISHVEIKAKRILFATLSFPNPNEWNDDFNSLSAELVTELADKGVILVGIDTPSVDLCHDHDLLSHQILQQRNLAVLEGVVLNLVPEGEYQLVALPLKIKGADASPVRAILIKN